MAYVAPNSTAMFFAGTALTPDGENTLYFANENDKINYWRARGSSITVSQVTYQREHRGWIRVELPMSRMYNVDYMMFKNTSFENKWFFAFVTAINYINNNCTEVQYVLDPMMTWMGWFSPKPCFVERQHTRGDAIGANIAEEGISVGPYIDEAVKESPNYGRDACNIRVVIANPDEAKANMFGGIYNPCDYHDFSSAASAANYISGLVGQDLQDNIVNVYMVPTKFANPGQVAGEFVQWAKPYHDFDGYVPKNNKMFCYPYKYLMVDNGEGSTQEYKYEYFNTVPDATSSGNFEFQIYGISGNNVQVKCSPVQYNGTLDYTDEYTIGMEHFPQCAWSVDTYQAYLAQKNAYLEHDIAQNNPIVGGRVVGQYAGGGEGSIIGGETGIGSVIGETAMTTAQTVMNFGHNLQQAKDTLTFTQNRLIDNIVRPEAGTHMRGSSATDLTFAQAQKKFFFHEKAITKNYAMMIDNYFTMYGYRIGQVITPNMNARPHWTYVKTVGCEVGGMLPASDRQAIQNRFDSGVRFWHNLDEMGEYQAYDNSPA